VHIAIILKTTQFIKVSKNLLFT